MFNIGGGEILLIAVVALLVLGPQRLPEMARTIGKALREFRRHTDSVRGVVEQEFYKMDSELLSPGERPAPPPDGPVAQGQESAPSAAPPEGKREGP